ncbi:hypothetical protein WJX74_004285 [Apatococcus lobatus]|uniref:protein-serine/threonine phosphatase n=1 Tax=Apatococcus lobatus TaxID=904363 RepID=A0AAW1Q7T9_9CHLO
MGGLWSTPAYLDKPVTEKTAGQGQNDRWRYGWASMQGWRVSLEDAHCISLDLDKQTNTSLFAIFDGHGGSACAQFCAKHLALNLSRSKAYKANKLDEALVASYLRIDDIMRTQSHLLDLELQKGEHQNDNLIVSLVTGSICSINQHGNPTSGCTAVTAIMRGRQLHVANVGDSRAYLCRGGKAKALTVDHVPSDFKEHERIEKAGGFVEDMRVNGSLAVSRALGDFEYKKNPALPAWEQCVSPLPDVVNHTLSETDEFLVLACDGIWNVMTGQQVIDFVRRQIQQGVPTRQISEALCDRCLGPSADSMGSDNMTVIIVLLPPLSRFPQPKVSAKDQPPAKDQAVANGDQPGASGSEAGPSSFAAAAANGHISDEENDGGMGHRSMSMESMRSGPLGLQPPDRLDSLLTQASTTSKDGLTLALNTAARSLGSLPSNPTVETKAPRS